MHSLLQGRPQPWGLRSLAGARWLLLLRTTPHVLGLPTLMEWRLQGGKKMKLPDRRQQWRSG